MLIVVVNLTFASVWEKRAEIKKLKRRQPSGKSEERKNLPDSSTDQPDKGDVKVHDEKFPPTVVPFSKFNEPNKKSLLIVARKVGILGGGRILMMQEVSCL